MICDFCVVSGFTEPAAIRKILSNTSDEELFKQYLFFHRLSDISTYAFPDDFPFDFDAYSVYVSEHIPGEMKHWRNTISELINTCWAISRFLSMIPTRMRCEFLGEKA